MLGYHSNSSNSSATGYSFYLNFCHLTFYLCVCRCVWMEFRALHQAPCQLKMPFLADRPQKKCPHRYFSPAICFLTSMQPAVLLVLYKQNVWGSLLLNSQIHTPVLTPPEHFEQEPGAEEVGKHFCDTTAAQIGTEGIFTSVFPIHSPTFPTGKLQNGVSSNGVQFMTAGSEALSL